MTDCDTCSYKALAENVEADPASCMLTSINERICDTFARQFMGILMQNWNGHRTEASNAPDLMDDAYYLAREAMMARERAWDAQQEQQS